MSALHATVGTAVILTSLAAGLWGAWCWYRVEASPRFWILLRTSQVVLVAQVILGGVVLASGREPPSLHVLYGLLPVGVSFVAEQLRFVAAEHVLQKHDLATARDMEGREEHEQRVIVFEIVRRETGVMAAASLVIFLLALRASGVAGFIL